MKKNWQAGLFFILCAIFVILSGLGFDSGVGWFNLVLALLLIFISISNIKSLNFFGILFPLALIAIIFDKQLGITAITPWILITATTLLSIGLSIIFKKRYDYPFNRPHVYYNHGKSQDNFSDTMSTNQDSSSDQETIFWQTSFSESTKFLKSDNLKEAHLKCSFGSLNIYFDQVDVSLQGATVFVDCNFGEIKLFIPRTFNVENNISIMMGDVKCDYPLGIETGKPLITLKGNVAFGNINIIRT